MNIKEIIIVQDCNFYNEGHCDNDMYEVKGKYPNCLDISECHIKKLLTEKEKQQVKGIIK